MVTSHSISESELSRVLNLAMPSLKRKLAALKIEPDEIVNPRLRLYRAATVEKIRRALTVKPQKGGTLDQQLERAESAFVAAHSRADLEWLYQNRSATTVQTRLAALSKFVSGQVALPETQQPVIQ